MPLKSVKWSGEQQPLDRKVIEVWAVTSNVWRSAVAIVESPMSAKRAIFEWIIVIRVGFAMPRTAGPFCMRNRLVRVPDFGCEVDYPIQMAQKADFWPARDDSFSR